jgi:deoxyribonuclease-4
LKHSPQSPLLLGAHTSAAGGAPHALQEGARIGATTIQLFTSNQRQWHDRKISQEEQVEWQRLLHETGICEVMSHASYLLNLGSPNPEVLQKSRVAFRQELKRCHLLQLAYLNFHPGSATDGQPEACLDRIVESLLESAEIIEQGKTRILIETTAGQGSNVGYCFEQLSYIIEKVKDKIPIGVCIDTCHIFTAGYDIRHAIGWDQALHTFDAIVGLHYLYALHLNDSAKPWNSRLDRHASLGDGHIGMETFKRIMTHPQLSHIPKYLETPDGPEKWREEIALLKTFAQETA